MSDADLRVLLVLIGYCAAFLVPMATVLIRPRLVPLRMLNASGNMFFMDIAAARSTFLFCAVFFLANAIFKQRGDANEIIGAVLFAAMFALIAGVYVHIIWRRAVRPHP